MLKWNVDANGWATEGTVLVLGLAYLICAVGFSGLGQIFIWLEFIFVCFAHDALGSVPVQVAFLLAERFLLVTHVGTLTKILNSTKHVLCNGFLVFNNFLNDNCLWEGFFNSFRHQRLGSTIEQSLLTIAEGVSLDVA